MQTLPLRLLLNAEPFGFGPSAAIAALFPYVRPYFDKVGYIGKKHTLDLQRKLPYDALHDVTGTFKDRRGETYASIFSGYDILFTAMDHKMALEARKAGLRVFYYDALTWYWPQIPKAARKSDLYVAQNFFGVHERLVKDLDTHPAAHIVAPLGSTPHTVTTKKGVLVNLGGLQNPYWPIEEVVTYARAIIDMVRQVIPTEETMIIAASENVVRLLNDKTVRTYARADMEDILARSKMAFMTPGLGNIYDAATYNLPTIWLPPANDSQGLQLCLLQKHGMSDAALDWKDIGETINYNINQQVVLKRITQVATQLAAQSKMGQTLTQMASEHYQSLSLQRYSKTAQLVRLFGTSGTQETARLVIERARDFVAHECYFSLPGAINGSLRSPHNLANDAEAQLQIAAHAPGITFNHEKPSHIDVTLEHIPSESPRLEENGPRISLYAPKEKIFPADIRHLLYGIERRELLKREFYAVHAACVGKKDDYTLIIGHSGAGKTTLAQNLVDKFSYQLFSSNKTVVRFEADGLKAVAGTKTMTALDRAGHRHAYQLRDTDYSTASDGRINSIALVRVNDGVEEKERLHLPSLVHTLYPYFMDTVNADVIVNGSDVFDGAASEATKRGLVDKLWNYLPTIPVMRISGSMEYMEKAIQNL